MTVAFAPVFLTACGDGVEYREPFVNLAALAWGDPSDDVGAVFPHLLGVERSRRAGQPLNDQPGFFADEDGHYRCPSSFAFAERATIFLAPSAMSSAEVNASPDSPRSFLPSSTFVPSKRTTNGTFSPTCFTAAITPAAIVSHFMMPPKMFTKIPRTVGSAVMILNAAVTFSVVALPPTSKKVGRLAAEVLDGVHGRHRQSGAVDHASDAAVQLDEAEIIALGLGLRRLFLVEIAIAFEFMVSVERVVVEGHLAVERQDLPVLQQDQRIHLQQGSVGLDEHAIKRQEELGPGFGRRTGQPQAVGQVARLIAGEADGGVDHFLQDLFGMLGRDLFDFNAPLPTTP